MIQLALNEGRTVEVKKALYRAVADGLYERVGLRAPKTFYQSRGGEEGELVLRQRHRAVRLNARSATNPRNSKSSVHRRFGSHLNNARGIILCRSRYNSEDIAVEERMLPSVENDSPVRTAIRKVTRCFKIPHRLWLLVLPYIGLLWVPFYNFSDRCFSGFLSSIGISSPGCRSPRC